MLRPRFIFWLFAVFIAFVLNNIAQHKVMMILMVFLLTMPIFSAIYSYGLRRKVSVKVSAKNEYIQRNENATWDFHFENQSRIQAMFVQVSIQLQNIVNKGRPLRAEMLIHQRDQQIIRVIAKSAYSGPFNLDNVSVYIHDIFGFFKIKLFSDKDLDIPNIYVLPLEDNSSNYKKYLSNQMQSGEFPAGKSQVLLDEISRFREMAAGDSLKLVHWKLSARMQEWMVKEFDREDDRSVTVLLNLPHIDLKDQTNQYEKLVMRNFMLDHAYTALEIFLSNRASIRLKTYQPELVEQEASQMVDIELLRKQLAFIPFRNVMDFRDQLKDEQYDNELSLIYLLTYYLDDSLILDLKNIRTQIGAMLLVYVVDQNTDMNLVQSQVEQLETSGIIVEVAKSHEVNLYE